ncbi:CDP-glycerol glycerophosphotransferase family protein [Aquibacillus saliphilus]|uniref:CDP-glycerol glycerophosphotransferase family protein n=1 Tax=Aquibacillus saliphilus TaxID=1909422 RepID=UPI001CF0A580|nr:CDP-glycerol glycerophosphotransferase family protein [Aquibacillus saliphilus]
MNKIKSKVRQILKGTKSPKKSPIKLKQKLTIIQANQRLTINGCLRKPHYQVKELWFVSRIDRGRVIKIPMKSISSEFSFEIDYEQLIDMNQWGERDVFDLYLNIIISKDDIDEREYNSLQTKSETVIQELEETFEYRVRLGKFEETIRKGFQPIEIFDSKYLFYISTKGNISVKINHDVRPNLKMKLQSITTNKHSMDISGKVFTKNSDVTNAKLVIRGRDNNSRVEYPTTLNPIVEEIKRKFGLNRYQFNNHINFNELFNENQLNEDIYDIYLELELHDHEDPILIRVGNPTYKNIKFKKDISAIRNRDVFAISPYYTVKKFNLSLQIDQFDRSEYNYLQRMMRWSWLIRPFYKNKNIWIVGERPYKAQDTGYHFFKYSREKHKNKNIYYVIDENSPELKNIKDLGNILYYKSKKHIKYTLMSTRVISSHHPDYIYPLRTSEFKNKVKAYKVFLQHGVIGTKNTVHFYGKKSPSFYTDLFLTSSKFEKNLIINDFGYKPSEVEVTGLSRFDSLFNSDIKEERQLLIIPTWREWLVTDEKFLASIYFERYRSLVNDPYLHQLAKEYNFEVVFCLHPNMQKFTSYFKDAPVKVINQGEEDVQDLLKESSMMITDYSSVAFDFSFLEKPIVYYQFDRQRFIGKKGSHLDLDNDLPGDIVYEHEAILGLVEEYAKSNFKMKESLRIRAAKFLDYKDQLSSERIYQAIDNFTKDKGNRILESNIYKKIFKRYRKSKYYYPSMRLFYNLGKKILPVDEKLILFESGVGKQYSDSPRYIYEELVRRNLGYKFVWVTNQKIPFHDNNTIKIKRLSPSYFYYLVKARFWVNNQNFPTYIIKRPETTYIQTWHGTPLKKMLFDIENVQGRSDDYLDRVYRATQTWDYLISPSPYASEAFRSAFKYEGNIMEIGYPRNDIFYNSASLDIASRVKSKLNIPKDKKVILYAPTFRDDQTSKKNKFLFEIQLDLEKMKETLGDEYVLLLRMHVVVSNKLKIPKELTDFAIDASKYSDIQELYLITDVLVTDYSSVMFDFANTRKPILYFTYDLDLYRDQIRGFYMNFEKEAPGPLLKSTDEVVNSINNIKSVSDEYKDLYDSFVENYCALEDGNASARLVNLIFDKSK